jgi:hypothetical protein
MSAGAPAKKKEKKEKKEKKKKEKKAAVAGGFLNKGKKEDPTTAAKHTYDKGYDKWKNFDVVRVHSSDYFYAPLYLY